MPDQITNHASVLDAIRSVKLIDELVEKHNGHFTYELDLEVIAYGRNYTGKKVGPYLRLFLFGPGEEIIREGEWGGNSFFLLVEGQLDVYVEDGETGDRKKVNEVQPGRSFGEMSVLAGLPRNATIVVPQSSGSHARVLEIDRPALRLLRKLPRFGGALEATYREYGLKRTIENLDQETDGVFGKDGLKKLEAMAEFRVFGKQHVLFREDKPIDHVIFIKNGWVRRTRDRGVDSPMTDAITDAMMEVDRDVCVDFLGAGNCLGLEGLRGIDKWQYTATVLARTEVLEIPLAQLRNDPTLRDTLYRTFSEFSQVDDEVLPDSTYEKPAILAVSNEIGTGIIDGTNLLVMDMDLCIRCGNCSMACHKVHGASRLMRRGIHIERPVKPTSNSIQHVLAPEVCLHCQDPECLTGCPTGAIGRFPGGQIDIEPKTCIGCGDCATQCPYNAISMVPRKREGPLPFRLRLKHWISLAPPELPPPLAETDDLLAVKCNLCNNTPLNPAGASKPAFSCQENCPTGALVRVNPKEYFDEAKNAVGLIYQDQTHAIGRDIHKSDPLAKIFHVAGVIGLVVLSIVTLWAARKYTLDGRLAGTWLTVRWITGMFGLVGIAAVMTYPGRKQVYRRRAGPLRYWLLAHVYLGVIAGVGLLLHGGRNSGGVLTSTLMVSFDLVILSGLFGIACYVIVPRIMTSIEGDPLLFEDLKARREELRQSLALIDTSNIELRDLIKDKVRRRFLSFSYLVRQYVQREPLAKMLDEAHDEFEAAAAPLTEASARQLFEAVETTATLRRVDALIYLHQLLKLWLAPHVVSSALMLALLFVHVIQVVFFATR